ncbi:MAG: PAS domain-containing protein [Clostridia bacterium]|nr:PAS domain-containing protein [Clostridia bacterium]
MLLKIQNASLQTKIILLFMVMGLVLTSVFNMFFYQNTIDNTIKAKENEMISLAQMTSNKIERFLFERTADIKVLSNSKLFTSPEFSHEVKANYLKNMSDAYQTYEAIFVLDLKGNLLESVGLKAEESINEELMTHFLSGNSYISDIIIEENNENYLYFSEPLHDDQGIYQGVIVEKMNFNAIQEIIASVQIGSSGFASMEQYNKSFKLNALQTEVMNNTTYFVATQLLTQYETQSEKWVIQVFLEKKEALLFKEHLGRYILLILIASLLMFFIVSYFISRRITRPIRNLMKKTSALIENNASFSNQLIISDEVKTLASFFDVLLDELHFMMQQVLEKTGEAAYIDELRKSIDALFDHMPNGIITIDANGYISSVNAVALDILETSKDILKHGITDSTLPENLNPLLDHMKEALFEGKTFTNEIIYLNQDTPIVFNTFKQMDLHDHLIGLTVTLNNYNHKKSFDESILRAKNLAELGEMSAGVAHEIRNPLSSIKGYTQLALREVKQDSQLYNDLNVILSEVDRLDKIVERFMSFARPNAPHKKYCHMNALIEKTIEQIQNGMQLGNILITHKFTKKDDVFADPEQLKQVILNLLLNSIQAMPHGGEIQVITLLDEESHTMEIQIVDNGEGMDSALTSKVFAPFFTTRPSGTGLGLSICSRIIENHQGIIEINSQKNKGTQIMIRIPFKENMHENT